MFATQNANYRININKDVTIEICILVYRDMEDDYINSQNGLYWDLLVWGKNAGSKLNNKTGHLFIFIDVMEENISMQERTKNSNDIIENIVFENDYEIKDKIFSAISKFFNINVNYNSLNSIQVFFVNYKDSGLSINEEISCDDIFFTIEGANIYINAQKDWEQSVNIKRSYFIEEIVLKKKNIKNVRFVT
jgi:hypothetical protein